MPNSRGGLSAGHVPEGPLVWDVDPTAAALASADEYRRDPDVDIAFEGCTEVGRRMLLAQFEFSSWVLRRVEKVSLVSDRRIRRSSSIELQVPAQAPVVRRQGGEPCWLVPLSVMRRRTLVDLDLRTEDGQGMSLLGLRFTQQLDESMLRAAARLVRSGEQDHRDIDAFIHTVVSGRWQDVRTEYERYRNWQSGKKPTVLPSVVPYLADATFRAALERMWHNFTLWVLLPVADGRERVLHLAFEERIEWRYQRPHLQPEAQPDGTEVWAYKPMTRWAVSGPWHYFGWRATRIRFLTPSAENCASYHFEFVAPTGLWVTRAAFVGGRPNPDGASGRPGKGVSWDVINTTEHSVGLHAVEVPNGSLCRAQVHLRAPSRGWLSTLVVSCLAAVLALATVAWHAALFNTEGHWTSDQVTNIVLLLVTVCAGASTYVAQHGAGDVAARMLTGVRIGAALALTLPAVAAVFLVYLADQSGLAKEDAANQIYFPDFVPDAITRNLPDTITRDNLMIGLWALWGLALALFLLVVVAWASSWWDQHLSGRASPWDMTALGEKLSRRQRRAHKKHDANRTYHQLLADLHMKKKAVGVYSAEGWHERYGWSDDAQREALKLLEARGLGDNPTNCLCEAVSGHWRQ